MAKVTVAELAEQVAAMTKLLEGLQGAPVVNPDGTPAKPSRRGRSNKPEAATLLPIGSTFEYRKGKKGSRQRWTTYEIVAHDNGRMAAMQKGSDSSFVSRWTPEALNKPYIRNVKPAS